MKKMNFLGSGPVIAAASLPWVAVSIFLSSRYHGVFVFSPVRGTFLLTAGIVLISTGFVLYFLTVPSLLKGLKGGKLVTSGMFYLCRNPLYCSIILFIIPGLSFLLNSWLVITTSIVAYIAFKFSIRKEYIEMRDLFGEEYTQYSETTPEFFPFPFRKLFGRN
ncbi:MAG TPA: hypothetical protein VMT63_11130 [Bacteroidales bacterium]|nr:hypothetical protein [Bacteroidales bacterium]